MRYVYVVQLHVAVGYVQMFIVAQQCFCGIFVTQRCKFYVPVFERNYIVTNFHSFTTINAVFKKKKNVPLLIVFF